jgi:hypothetical protein
VIDSTIYLIPSDVKAVKDNSFYPKLTPLYIPQPFTLSKLPEFLLFIPTPIPDSIDDRHVKGSTDNSKEREGQPNDVVDGYIYN